jgi:hypothetical protein
MNHEEAPLKIINVFYAAFILTDFGLHLKCFDIVF